MTHARLSVLVLLLAGVGCERPTRTQVLVHINADASVVAASRTLRVTVVATDDTEGQSISVPVAEITFPQTQPVHPFGDDATRSFEVVAELLDEDGSVVVSDRAIGTYLAARRSHVRLVLSPACLGVSCSDRETCIAGTCDTACVTPDERTFEETNERSEAGQCEGTVCPSACPLSEVCTRGVCVPDPVVDIAAGQFHSCVVTESGRVLCWGANERQQRGRAAVEDSAVPVTTPLSQRMTALDAGTGFTCSIGGEGAVYCWGDNTVGQLGICANPFSCVVGCPDACDVRPTPASSESPQRVSGACRAEQLATTMSYVCIRCADTGEVQCWGENLFGGVGLDPATAPARFTPYTVPGLSGVVDIAVSDQHSCAVRGDGRVWCWGFGQFGQLGNGDTLNSFDPVLVMNITDAAEVWTGDALSCARHRSGALSCWGRAGERVLGEPVPTTNRSVPVQVNGITDVRSLPSSGWHSLCAVVGVSGEAWCWGENLRGELGRDTAAPLATPGPVGAPLTGVSRIALGGAHTCAIVPPTTVWCWGNNDRSQVGDGMSDNTDRLTPSLVLGEP